MTTAPTMDRPVAGGTGRSSGPAQATRFRPDIDGLRALAILLVVAFHAELPGFDAGFVGVDIFFVISGYLIMGQLDGELLRTDRLRLTTFWARRARRLIPATVVTALFVVVATQLVTSPLGWKRASTEVLAALFYWSNELYRHRATDYFAGDLTASPLLHTWSLAVEEQFYVFWPVLLAVVHRVRSGDAGARRRARIATVAGAMVVSFIVSVDLTGTDQPTAFFSAISRAWEFGIGALLALTAGSFARWGRTATRVVGVAGVGLLLAALATIDAGTAFPGWAALLPVGGTAALIVAGSGRDRLPATTLGWSPFQYLGRLSYSWYLWHWPLLVLGMRWLEDDGLGVRAGLVAAALVPAVATHHLVESPLRHNPRLVASNLRTAAAMALLLVVGAASAVGLSFRAETELRDPFLASLAAARADTPPLPLECATTDEARLLADCTWGAPDGGRTVLLLGDSHAGHWLPTMDRVGQRHDLRVVASMQGNCPSVGSGWALQLPSCGRRIDSVGTLLEELHPDLVVMSHSVGYLGLLVDEQGDVLPEAEQLPAWQKAHERRAIELRELGVPLLVILDTPRHPEDPIECLGRHRDPAACSLTRQAVRERLAPAHDAERDGLGDAGFGTAFDPLPLLCSETVCPVVDPDGRIVYADSHHLSPGFARTLAEPLSAAVLDALGG